MATFITLGSFTDQGVRAIQDTVQRAEALRAKAKKLGATVKDVFWTLGSIDTVTIVEAPDEATVTALWMSVGAMGNIRTQTLRAFTADEVGPILKRLG